MRRPFTRACRVSALDVENNIYIRGYKCGEIEHKDDGKRYDWPCFATIFRYINNSKSKEFDIQYSFKITKDLDSYCSNAAFLKKHEFLTYIREIKRIVPFNYRINNCEGSPFLFLDVRLKGIGAEHKLFMMLSRIFFEYDHSMAAIDAMRLKKLHIHEGINFNKFNLITLYLLCLTSQCLYSPAESLICCPYFVPLTIKTLKEKVGKVTSNNAAICGIFTYTNPSSYNYRRLRNSNENKIRDDEDFVSNRLCVYIQNIRENENFYSLGVNRN